MPYSNPPRPGRGPAMATHRAGTFSRLVAGGLIAAGLVACTAQSASDAAPEPRQGHATGRVVDTRGNPVPGAKILLENTVFHSSSVSGSTGPDGRYRLKVYPGAWQAWGTLTTEYHGKTYRLDLHPENPDSMDENGGVRDFTWKLEGRDPRKDHAHYGGQVAVFGDYHFYDMEDVELTLEPDGPLIDGSEGRTLVLRPDDHHWSQLDFLRDIPIGRYVVTARLLEDGGTRPLRIRDRDGRHEATERFRLEFEPEGGSSTGAVAAIVIGR